MSAAPVGGGRRGGPMGGGPMGRAMGGGEKAKNFKSTMQKLIRYLKQYWIQIIIVAILAIASTVFTVLSPKILGNITTQVANDYVGGMIYDKIVEKVPKEVLTSGITMEQLLKNMPKEMTGKITEQQMQLIKDIDLTKGRPQINFNKISQIALFLILLYLLSALFSYLQGYIITGVSQKVTYQMRKEISEKINRIPLKFFDNVTHGDILSRITNDVDLISQSFSQSLTQIVTAIATIIGILIMMLSISWQMTLVAILTLPLSLGFVGFIVKKSQKYFKAQQKSLGELNGHVEEMYGGHNVVKVFNGEARSIKIFKGINGDLFQSAMKSQFLSGLMMPIMLFIGNLGYVGVCVVGGWLAIKGTISIGDIQAFIQYVRQFNQPISTTASIANVLQSTAAAAERIFEFLEIEEEIAENSNPIDMAKIRGEVKFENVVFGYNEEKVIIKGLNLTVKAGQRVAIVGPTGAGKTTLVNLLMRFYDVNSGSIKIDGVDIRDMKRATARKLFGMVLQDTWLLNENIRENIRYGNTLADDNAVLSASEAAHVDHFIHSLPHGYDLVINEEMTNISQGQKQLLTIARVVLANHPMLILDEATSSVDTRTEVLIQKAMDNLMNGRTSFVIAHRLSTIRDADIILVMRDGDVIESGNHNELMEQQGFYCELYNSQFTVRA